MKKVVMAVNNPATIDFRVVKTAEMIVRSGYRCHVVGIWKPGFRYEETLNGVTYHRMQIKKGVRSLLLGFFPLLIRYLYIEKRDNRKIDATALKNVSKGEVKKTVSQTFLKQVWNDFIVLLNKILEWVYRSREKLMQKTICFGSRSSTIEKLWHKYVVNLVKKLPYKYIVNPAKKLLYKLLAKIHPSNFTAGVRYLQGRYLGTFYSKLIELDGDIYHAHELWTLESCAMVAKQLDKKLIYDSHELEPYRNNNWSPSSNKVRLSYEKRYINNADGVFAVSAGCANEIKKIYSLHDVHLLRNTPMLSKIKLPPIGLREKIGLGNDTPLMVYTGLMTMNRGIETLIESLLHLPDWHAATVGPWNDEVKKTLIQLAEQKGVLDRFHIHEKVPPEKLIEFISDGDLAVVPIVNACLSYYHCLPNKIFEAAFAGLPVVVSDLPDMKQFVADNKIGKTFQDGNAKSLADAVLSVSKDPQYPATPESKENLRKKYCFEQEIKTLLAVYQKLIPV